MRTRARRGGNQIACRWRWYGIAEIARPNPETVRDDVSMSIERRSPTVDAGGVNNEHQLTLSSSGLDLLERLGMQIGPAERSESGFHEGLHANGPGVRCALHRPFRRVVARVQ